MNFVKNKVPQVILGAPDKNPKCHVDDPEDEGNLHLVAVQEHDAVGGPKPHRVHPHGVRLPSVHGRHILFI